jgi:hypothetical protein
MRVGRDLRAAVLADEKPTIQQLISSAAKSVPAFVDACHKHAGAATVAPGMEAQFASAVAAVVG